MFFSQSKGILAQAMIAEADSLSLVPLISISVVTLSLALSRAIF